MIKHVFAAALAASALGAPAAAGTIVPVGVTASDTFSFFGQYRAVNLINGSGLTGATHDAGFANMWMTNLGVNQASLTFDLGDVYALNGVSLWNYNFGNPAEFMSTILRGVKDFSIFVSRDGTSYARALDARLALGTGQALAAQNFTLAGEARFVRIDILSNHAEGTYAERDWASGLSEVRFSGNAVPEPATWAMMVAGFGLAGAGLRRRRTRIAFA